MLLQNKSKDAPVRNVNAYGDAEAYLHSFSTSSLGGGELSASLFHLSPLL